ncbi:MAG TPA: glycosyltransferase [Thermoanaerobaculales bacterium]|nr:glycosyltransferase [Thermoanaerobaculales bacterium]HPA80531.1 glycosyltransferase [Thermoanaerobaculales bacterium]HQL29947.1 glycosyltransferase [Thermoanaerobaculales bacterium]HQN94905.1 glycosyltransferase [Thermoanaerobaculales bacterium]HQP42582.1 glycosyltransferase [Thermoanaerobaculales bacterium]
MAPPAAALRRVASRALRSLRGFLDRGRYRRALARGEPAGELDWTFDPAPPPPPLIELRLPAGIGRAAALAWRQRQTLPELRVVGVAADGGERWRIEPELIDAATPAAWFAAPGGLPELDPAHLESCLLTAAAEAVDAVVLDDGPDAPLSLDVVRAADVAEAPLRALTLYAGSAWRWDPAADRVASTHDRLLVKLVGRHGVGDLGRPPSPATGTRRGPYLASFQLGPALHVGVRDAAALGRTSRRRERPTVLVTAPFLARGGAEHTLHETMRELAGRFDFAIATLAPHRPELGDRRPDFRALTDRIYCLGDLVHPAAMCGMLLALIDSLGAEVLYNANSTTLFYEFGPRLKRERPALRIVDHLYDHRVGYIERYTPQALDWIDACVAENHRIAEALTAGRGWPAARVPVIWPCGRSRQAFPAPGTEGEVRRRIRAELGFADDDVVILTAARMHPQKRPLDLVELARRVGDLDRLSFLVVGGGDLEAEVDRAIAATGARVRRLPFRDDVPDLIVACDAGCLVSDFEGLPVFLLECLQAGRPFLGTDVGDMGDLLRRTGAGIVVEAPGDLPALEAAVRRLADGGERARLAARAAAAGARFDPAACAAAYADVLLGVAR